jgi:hypothetical protein
MTSMHQWAELHLDELAVKLLEDPNVYDRFGAKAAECISEYIERLRARVHNNTVYPNPHYHRQGDLASSLIILAIEYPERYTALMQHVVGDVPVRLIEGLSRLDSVLNCLSDDHEYSLVRNAQGEYRLYYQHELPQEYGFVSLTCSREFSAVTFEILAQAGFSLDGPIPSPALSGL